VRVVLARPKDSYHVHKTMIEFLKDTNQETIELESAYSLWLERLVDDSRQYALLMHSRKVVGMVWGQRLYGEKKKTFLVEGVFLRRAYRGKFRFTKEIKKLLTVMTKDFEVVRMVIPPSQGKLKNKHKVVATLVEVQNGK
jgi:hypothetical protein